MQSARANTESKLEHYHMTNDSQINRVPLMNDMDFKLGHYPKAKRQVAPKYWDYQQHTNRTSLPVLEPNTPVGKSQGVRLDGMKQASPAVSC
jgi:hypothetical protein